MHDVCYKMKWVLTNILVSMITWFFLSLAKKDLALKWRCADYFCLFIVFLDVKYQMNRSPWGMQRCVLKFTYPVNSRMVHNILSV